MPRRAKYRRLAVWMNGKQVGTWTVDAGGRHEFRYLPAWADDGDSRPISLSMPVRPPTVAYRGPIVEAYFDNLLPDSREIRRRAQARFGAESTSAFDLLTEIGRDCAGAVQLLAPGRPAADVRKINALPLDEAGVAEALRSAMASTPLGQGDDDAFRISLAGAQEKTALLWHEGQWCRPSGATPTTHLLKLPLGRVGPMQADLSTSVENEWLCAQIVREFGLPVANCDVAEFSGHRVLVVERFDRRLSRDRRWWIRLPQEDMCQATGTPPARRYESDGGPGITAIGALLLGSRQAESDRRRFFRAQALFWMMCATDGHAKNFSVFIEPRGRFSLAPLYDVISAYPVMGHGTNRLAPEKVRMAMAVAGKDRHYRWADIQARHWISTAARMGLRSTAQRDVEELKQRAPDVVERVSAQLPRDFPESVSGPIFDGMLQAARRLSDGIRRYSL